MEFLHALLGIAFGLWASGTPVTVTHASPVVIHSYVAMRAEIASEVSQKPNNLGPLQDSTTTLRHHHKVIPHTAI